MSTDLLHLLSKLDREAQAWRSAAYRMGLAVYRPGDNWNAACMSEVAAHMDYRDARKGLHDALLKLWRQRTVHPLDQLDELDRAVMEWAAARGRMGFGITEETEAAAVTRDVARAFTRYRRAHGALRSALRAPDGVTD